MRVRATWLTIALLAAALPAYAAKPPNVQWTRTFAGWGDAIGYCVQQTSDGGYIAVGTTNSLDSGYAVLLVKVSASGDSLWARTFKAAGGTMGASVVQTSDGGYIVAGGSTANRGHWDPCLIRTDALGHELWRSLLANEFSARASAVVRLGDTAYAVVVKRYLSDSAVVLYRTDNMGNIRWSHAYKVFYDLEDRDEELSLRRTSDGGYIIGTKTLLKVDSLGTQQQLKTFGSLMNANSVIQTSDGGYAATGAKPDYSSVYLLKTNANGDSTWAQTYMPSPDGSRGHWVEPTADGGYIIAGTISPSGDFDKVVLMRTYSSGSPKWGDTLFTGYGHSVRPTADGGYIVSGLFFNPTVGSEGTGYLFVTKLAPDRRR